jgi:hypothetical protein
VDAPSPKKVCTVVFTEYRLIANDGCFACPHSFLFTGRGEGRGGGLINLYTLHDDDDDDDDDDDGHSLFLLLSIGYIYIARERKLFERL